MTTTPDAASPDAPGWEVPADDVADEEVDVTSLAGQRPPAGGAWLWVITADARRGVSSPPRSCRATVRWPVAGMCCCTSLPAKVEVEHWTVPAARVRVWAVASWAFSRRRWRAGC
jgi:hypothetical protein